MYTYLYIAALVGSAVAAPRPQVIEVEAAEKLPLPTVLGPELAKISATPANYNPTSAASAAAAAIPTDPISVEKRGLDLQIYKRAVCQQEPGGAGPIPGNGSVAAYLASDSILAMQAEQASTPSGYIKSFTNLQGSTQQIGYLTFQTLPGANYDVNACAAFCTRESFCLGFNIFYERDPSVDPGTDCENPAPVTNIKCSIYGFPVAADSATNQGQWRGPQDAQGEAFHVVIAGSNGYSKLTPPPTPAPITNFTGPSNLLTGAINAPLFEGTDTYIGMKLYNDGPYDPSLCAAACQAQTAYNRATAGADGTYKPCNFFNSYILTKNDVPQGTYCSFYTMTWDNNFAINTGYTSGSDKYAVQTSFTYFLSQTDSGLV